MIGNVQVSRMLDESTFPTEIDFQFSSRVSIAVQMPLFFDSINNKEMASLEMGIGNLFNSLYFKNSNQDNPRNSSKINNVDGFFLKLEPSFLLLENKSKTLFFHAYLNNVLYLFGNYEVNSGFIDQNNDEIRLITASAKNKIQYAFEPYLGLSYFLKTKNNGFLFRIKKGYIFHNQPIASMSLSNQNAESHIKVNNSNWVFSVGFLLNSKK